MFFTLPPGGERASWPLSTAKEYIQGYAVEPCTGSRHQSRPGEAALLLVGYSDTLLSQEIPFGTALFLVCPF